MRTLLLITLLLMTGCKLEVTSNDGGVVEYSGGTCGTCEIEILDATYTETFIAVPAPGYVFSHWRGGDGYQCAGSPDPECVVSNTQFAGNAGAEAHIASDKTYYLEAVYRAQTAPRLFVIDGNGDVIGEALEYFPEWADARVVYTDEEGKEHGYVLTLFQDNVDWGSPYWGVYGWADPSCTGDPTHVLTRDVSVMEPLFSADIRVVNYDEQIPPQRLDLVRVDSQAVGGTIYSLSDTSCISRDGDLFREMTILERDITSQFTLPFGLDLRQL